MASVNQRLFDRQVEHSISQRRYSEAARLLLEREAKEHRGRLRELLSGNIRAALQPEINRYAQALYGRSSDSIGDFVGAEIDFQRNSLHREVGAFYSVSTPSRSNLSRRLTSTPLRINGEERGSNLRTGIETVANKELTRVNARVRQGLARGDSTDAIIASVVRTTRLSEAQAKTILTTNLTHAETLVTETMLEENPELFSGTIYTAILDSRTSRLCSRLDGRFQSVDNLKIRPPLHWNCRSTLAYVVKSKQLLQDAATVSDRFDVDRLAVEDSRLFDGANPAQETFTEWLRRQNHETKLKYLDSDEKVALFEGGSLKLSDFLSFRGNPISIAALRVRDNVLTYVTPVRANPDRNTRTFDASRPFQLVRSRQLQNQLRDFFVANSVNSGNPLSLVDFKGTTLLGKRAVRTRSNNQYDPRVNQVDSFTGATVNTLLYEPDFLVFRERMDYMLNSKLLSTKEKEFLERFVNSLEGRISANQQTVVLENLRVIFERYARNREPWDNLEAVLVRELGFSVVNTSRILDRRSRTRAAVFNGWTGDSEEPSIMILGERFTIRQLSDRKLANERFTRAWQTRYGRDIARRLLYQRKAPWRLYFANRPDKARGTLNSIIDSYRKKAIRAVFYKKNPRLFYLRYGKVKSVKDILRSILDDLIPFEELRQQGALNYLRSTVREKYRNLVDLEFLVNRRKKSFADRFLGQLEKAVAGEELSGRANDAVNLLARLVQTIGEGVTTDYDSLAIQLGTTLIKEWPGFAGRPSTLASFHAEGSRVLKFFQDAGFIRVNSRGVTRRAVTDLDTLRPSGAWKDTVSREVQVLEPRMLELQSAARQILVANRTGVTLPRNRYYVKAGHKTYFDARGENTGIPIITRSAFADFDANRIDKDFADMLNWQMDARYVVDPEFSTFMDNLVRFKDSRGNVAKYDALNAFRDEIVRRGDQGFGLMETVRYYRDTGLPFRYNARIDSRGRIYYNGYLTPTGGEVVRPFLNSFDSQPMTPAGMDQLKIQMASVIGPGTEALTTAGRLAIFRRHEASILRVGRMLTETTQRDRRIREFLEDPFVQSIDGEEVAKIARFALEYYRVHRHMGGDLDFLNRGASVYRIQDSRGRGPFINNRAGRVIQDFDRKKNPFPVPPAHAERIDQYKKMFPEFDFEVIDFDRKSRFAFNSEQQLRNWFSEADLERLKARGFSIQRIDNVDIVDSTNTQVTFRFRSPEKLKKLSTYRTQLMGEADASASGLQVIALSTGNRGAALTSNVVPTRQKQRVYDLTAQDTVADPRFQAMLRELNIELTWEDLSRAAKYQNMLIAIVFFKLREFKEGLKA